MARKQRYVGVSLTKSFSESANHCDPFDNMGVNGDKSISEMATGFFVGTGLRAISGGAAFLATHTGRLASAEILRPRWDEAR